MMCHNVLYPWSYQIERIQACQMYHLASHVIWEVKMFLVELQIQSAVNILNTTPYSVVTSDCDFEWYNVYL